MFWRIFKHVLRCLVSVVVLTIGSFMLFMPTTRGSLTGKWICLGIMWVGYACLLWWLYVLKKVHRIA